MSALLQHAKFELRNAGLFDADADYDGAIAVNVTSLMEVLTAYGHSGASAEQTLDIFNKLAKGMPLTPLTGEDSEWGKPEGAEGEQIQVNKRCIQVFKDKDIAWDVRKGYVAITFPYDPNS